MNKNISNVLDKLRISNDNGRYENHFYVVQLADSDEYAKMYTQLESVAVNTEYPNFGANTNKTVVKITNYFEIEVDNISYNIFLIADFDKDSYYVKIGEQ